MIMLAVGVWAAAVIVFLPLVSAWVLRATTSTSRENWKDGTEML
jgi:hypothetical protein